MHDRVEDKHTCRRDRRDRVGVLFCVPGEEEGEEAKMSMTIVLHDGMV